MEEKILIELQEIKRVLQDIRSILEPKEIKIMIDEDEIVKSVINSINSNSRIKGDTVIAI